MESTYCIAWLHVQKMQKHPSDQWPHNGVLCRWKLSQNTDWKREDLPEDQPYETYLSTLNGDDLRNEFVKSTKHLWFDVPNAALTTLTDTLAVLVAERVNTHPDKTWTV